jgi:hypothetical protein
MKITLTRFFANCLQTVGELQVGKRCFLILEPKWENNDKKVSCIPLGTYKVVKRNSPKYGDHFHILDVPDRSLILIHNGNFYQHSQGCLLAGMGIKEINGDGQLDVTESKNAMELLNDLLPKEFEIEIVAHQLPSFIVTPKTA